LGMASISRLNRSRTDFRIEAIPKETFNQTSA